MSELRDFAVVEDGDFGRTMDQKATRQLYRIMRFGRIKAKLKSVLLPSIEPGIRSGREAAAQHHHHTNPGLGPTTRDIM